VDHWGVSFLAALAVFEVIIGRVTERGYPHVGVGGIQLKL
jgi:hypothetical protein